MTVLGSVPLTSPIPAADGRRRRDGGARRRVLGLQRHRWRLDADRDVQLDDVERPLDPVHSSTRSRRTPTSRRRSRSCPATPRATPSSRRSRASSTRSPATRCGCRTPMPRTASSSRSTSTSSRSRRSCTPFAREFPYWQVRRRIPRLSVRLVADHDLLRPGAGERRPDRLAGPARPEVQGSGRRREPARGDRRVHGPGGWLRQAVRPDRRPAHDRQGLPREAQAQRPEASPSRRPTASPPWSAARPG